MNNSQNIKKGDMVYIKCNKGPPNHNWTVGKTCTVIDDFKTTLTSRGYLLELAELDLKDPYDDKTIFALREELIKINPKDNILDLTIEKELELV